MKLRTLIIYGFILSFYQGSFAQGNDYKWGFEKKHFIGTQAFVLLTALLQRIAFVYLMSNQFQQT